jgi:hypothetical protein
MNYPASDSGRRVWWGILVAVLAVSTARAQETQVDSRASGAAVVETPTLAPGQRVRVTASSPAFTGMTVGKLVKIGPDSLTLVDVERGSVMELALNSVSRIEVGTLHRQTRKGALIGLAVGAVFTIAIFASDEAVCGPYGNSPCSTEDNVLMSAFSVAASVGIGAWWGHSKKSEKWLEAPLPGVKVGVRPERGGGRVRLAFSF